MPKPAQAYEVKLFPVFFITKADKATGIVEAIVSVTGVTDYHDDIIVAGAFKKTIAERSRKVKVLNHHNSWSVNDVISICLEMRRFHATRCVFMRIRIGAIDRFPLPAIRIASCA